MQTIELDCAPGALRPDALIADVIKDTGLPLRESVSRFFGNYTWDYSDIDPETWNTANPTIKTRIEALYNLGAIRYGSW
jgi:hypothetical protein